MSNSVNELVGPVHNSHLTALKQCEKKFDYSFTQQIEAKRGSLPLARGIWIHYMLGAQHLKWGWQADSLLDGLPEYIQIDEVGDCPIVSDESSREAYIIVNEKIKDKAQKSYPLSAKGMLNLLTEQVWSRLLPGEHDRYTEDGYTLPDACERIVREYIYHYDKYPLPEDAKILGVEVDWQREHRDVMFEGRIDLVYETRGLIVVRDWKTTKSKPTGDFKFMESQLNLYPWGIVPWLIEHGMDPKKATHSAVEFDYLVTKLPTRPSLNQDGTVSKRKIATSRLTVMEFVKEHGLKWKVSDLEHYMDAYCTDTEFFQCQRLPRNQKVIHRLLDENVETTNRMLPVLTEERVAIRNVGRHCDYMCDFQQLCKSELYGEDVRYLRKTQYQPRNYLRHIRESDDE